MAEMSHASGHAEALSQAKSKDERPVYEVGFHIVPTVAEGDIGAVVEKIRAELAKSDAEIIKEEFPHKMHLAYVIDLPAGRQGAAAGKREKYAESYFGWMKFAVANRSAIPALEAMLHSTHEVLRSLIIETLRDEAVAPRRAVFSSDRLEGETIKKPVAAAEPHAEVSEEELDKSIDALVTPN